MIRLLRVSIGQQLPSPAQTLRTDPAVGTAKQQHRRRLLGLASSNLMNRELIQAIALPRQRFLLQRLQITIHQTPQRQGSPWMVQRCRCRLPAQQQPSATFMAVRPVAAQEPKRTLRGTAADQPTGLSQDRLQARRRWIKRQQAIPQQLLLSNVTLLPRR